MPAAPSRITTNPDYWDSQPAGANGTFGVWYRLFATLLLCYICYTMVMALARTF
jgi:hypothetical protein